MKTIITALNSKFIHLSLAPWYLKVTCGNECGEVKVREFTINEKINNILSTLLFDHADVYAFSCYIWNIEYVLKLASDIKKVKPCAKIILGGPEVSYDAKEIIKKYSYIDYIISGEGETAFKQLLTAINQNNNTIMKTISGLTYKDEDKSVSNCCKLERLPDSIPSPYIKEMLENMENRIVYFESSRGCPFSCSYCLSSTCEGVRYFSLERVKSELLKLIKNGVHQIKFVDRTFNCNKKRAIEIFKFIIEHQNDNINFHFEVAADLFDEEMFAILQDAPAGLIQFEIGIQSTNEDTLMAVNRKTDIKKVLNNIKRLQKPGNIHIHVDLIAGLPLETYKIFQKSFNDAYLLCAHNLQLGFLKLLKGSGIRENKEQFGYIYRDYPPYEILSNNFISFYELTKLNDIEEVLDRYYNSGRFVQSLKFITSKIFSNPFEFYYEFSKYYRIEGYFDKPASSQSLYDILLAFLKTKVDMTHYELLNELMKFDYLRTNNTRSLPKNLKRIQESSFHQRCFDFLKDENNIAFYLPAQVGFSPKQVFKNVHFEMFSYDILSTQRCPNVILFDHTNKDKVTGLSDFHIVVLSATVER